MSLKNKDISSILNEGSSLFLLLILFVCGLLFGSTLYFSGNHFSEDLIKSFLSFDFPHFLVYILSDTVLCVIAGMVGGFCAIGTFILCLIPFLRGLGVALLSSYLIGTYAAKGLGYFSLIFLPGIIISVCVILYFMSESQMMSKTVAKMAFRGEREVPDIKTYFAKAVFTAVIMIFSAFITLISFKLFSGLF